MYNVMNIDAEEKILVLYIGNTGILVITRDQGHQRLNVNNKDNWVYISHTNISSSCNEQVLIHQAYEL